MYMNKEARLQEEKALLERWSWLTEGIESYDEKINTSIVLQNSYETMIQEGQLQEGWLESLLNEDEMLTEAPQSSAAVGSPVIPKVLFPVIRRVMPNLIANQIVSVQPITARTGVIYNIKYTYSDTKGNIAAGNEFSGSAQSPGVPEPGYSTWYSSEKIGPFDITVPAGATDASYTIDTDLGNFFGMDKNKFVIKRAELFDKDGSSIPANFIGVDSTTPTAVGEVALNPNGSNDDWNLEVFLPGNTSTEDVVYSAFVVYDQEATEFIPEMEFSIGSQTVDTTERKLKIRWTKEAEQDMKAFHKIDVEAELVKVASMQMNYEIDRELITFITDHVHSDLKKTHNWKADAPTTGNNTSGNYLDRHRALSQKISMLSAKIAQYNRQGAANWAVVSPQIHALLQMLPDFKGEIAGNSFNTYYGGMLSNGIKVYVDPNKATPEEILLGYKSNSSVYGAGVVYSPYTNWMSNTVTHPDNFNSIRGFFSRYAVTLVERGEYFYGNITIKDLDLL